MSEPKDLAQSLLQDCTPPYWIEGLSEESYRASQSFVSSTSLKKILKSPRSFFCHHFQDCSLSPPTSPDMLLGKLIHKATLEPLAFRKLAHVMPEFSGATLDGRASPRSKEALLKRQAWLDSLPKDSVIITSEQNQMLESIVLSIASHPVATTLLAEGQKEISGFFRHPDSGIRCRIRPDFLSLDNKTVIDLKTTRDCTALEFSKTIWSHRYDFQIAMYMMGVEIITGTSPDFAIFVAVEKEPPFEVAVYAADKAMIDKAKEDVHLALMKLRYSIDTDRWTGYQEGIEEIRLPLWTMNHRQLLK